MKTMQIQIPDKKMPFRDKDGIEREENAFIHFIGALTDAVPQKSIAETILAHTLKEKIEAIEEDSATVDLEEAEVEFLMNGIQKIQNEGRMSGSGWYYAVKPLRDAQLAGAKKPKKDKKEE